MRIVCVTVKILLPVENRDLGPVLSAHFTLAVWDHTLKPLIFCLLSWRSPQRGGKAGLTCWNGRSGFGILPCVLDFDFLARIHPDQQKFIIFSPVMDTARQVQPSQGPDESQGRGQAVLLRNSIGLSYFYMVADISV